MNATLAPTRPESSAGRTTFALLAARELRRLVLNPVFLAAAALTAFFLWSGQRSTITAIEDVNAIAAVCFGGLVLDGWSVAWIATYQSGQPYSKTVTNETDRKSVV